jgi:hypothetical protein
MTSDPDIFRAAKLLINQHGDDVPIRAAQRADVLLDQGDVDGALVLRRILGAIDELRRDRRDGELLNLNSYSSSYRLSGRIVALPVPCPSEYPAMPCELRHGLAAII